MRMVSSSRLSEEFAIRISGPNGMTDLLRVNWVRNALPSSFTEIAMVNRRIVLLCLCAGLFLELPAARSEIQVGAAVRVITPDPDVTRARLGLIVATRQVLANTLGIIGVTAPERM